MPKLCKVENCGKPSDALGYCKAHYMRFMRHGDPLAGKKTTGRALKFIKETVMFYEGNECLKWPYGTNGDGRPSMSLDNRHVIPSRVICEMVHGAPPTDEHQAAHSCGNGDIGCVSKMHIRWATPVENAADKRLHGTEVRGEDSVWAKLEEIDIQMIRTLADAGFPQRKISERFGVSSQHVSKIVRKQKWAWLGDRSTSFVSLHDEGNA